MIKKVVTLDNLRVPFATDGKFKILSFRSQDPVFKADPGVVPDDETCAKAGITVVSTGYQHTDMSDRGPDEVKIADRGHSRQVPRRDRQRGRGGARRRHPTRRSPQARPAAKARWRFPQLQPELIVNEAVTPAARWRSSPPRPIS